MKKNKFFIISFLLIGLVVFTSKISAMTEAFIDKETCTHCGWCIYNQNEDAFHLNGTTAEWGEYGTGEFMGLLSYTYVQSRHFEDIELVKDMCPSQSVFYW